jgi:hypothetical protein
VWGGASRHFALGQPGASRFRSVGVGAHAVRVTRAEGTAGMSVLAQSMDRMWPHGVPAWVRQPEPAVLVIEHLLLTLWGRMKSSELLGARSAIAWLGGEDGQESRTPVTNRMGEPSRLLAVTEMRVADRVAEAVPYPPWHWWESMQVYEAERMRPDEWARRTGSGYERRYAHGVCVAYGWALGVYPDAGMMAPFRLGDGSPLTAEEREGLKEGLRKAAASR